MKLSNACWIQLNRKNETEIAAFKLIESTSAISHCEGQSSDLWQSLHFKMSKRGFVYILTNKDNKVLYTGVTSELVGRVIQHKDGTGSTFTSKYRVNKLVYYEVADDIQSAIEREKQIRSWNRKKKLELVNESNPEWNDLFSEIET